MEPIVRIFYITRIRVNLMWWKEEKTTHEKCNNEAFNQTIRHQNAAIEKLEELLELYQGQDVDEVNRAALTTVLGALQCIYIANDQSKCLLDDYDQKWKHTRRNLS